MERMRAPTPEGDITFQNGSPGAAQMWVMGSDGTGASQVTSDAGGYWGFSWALVTP